MPAHFRGKSSAEARFGRVIAALCKEHGGEIRIKAADMDFQNQPITLSEDWDATKQEVIIRLHSSFNSIYRVPAEEQEAQGELWTSKPSTAETTRPMNQEKMPRSTANLLEENERLIQLENKARAARIQQELRVTARLRNTPPVQSGE